MLLTWRLGAVADLGFHIGGGGRTKIIFIGR